MSYEKEIIHELTDEIICPFCGYEFSNSYEIDSDEEDLGLIQCESCNKSFYGTRNIEVTYWTQKATYGTCKKCGKDDVVIEKYTSSLTSYKDLCTVCGDKKKRNAMKKEFEDWKKKQEEV